MTDTWVNMPLLLPRRILIVSWRSPYFSTWHVQISPSSVGFVFPGVLLLVASVWDIFLHFRTGLWLDRIPSDLLLLVSLVSIVLTVLRWRTTHRHA